MAGERVRRRLESITAPYVYKTDAGSADVGFGNAPAFGVSFGRDASRLVGFELSWMRTDPAQQYTTSPPAEIRKVAMNIFELDSLWYFRRGTFQPYGIFGLGGASTGSSFGGTNLTVALGVGVKAFLSPHFAVRADIRWDNMYGNVGHAGDPAFCDSAGCYYYRTSWYSSLPVTVGPDVRVLSRRVRLRVRRLPRPRSTSASPRPAPETG